MWSLPLLNLYLKLLKIQSRKSRERESLMTDVLLQAYCHSILAVPVPLRQSVDADMVKSAAVANAIQSGLLTAMMTVSGEGSTKMTLVLGFLAQLNQAQALCPQVQISQIQALLASMLGFRLGQVVDGLGEAALQIRIVAPWSKESWSWRERRQDWTPSGDPVLPLPPQQNHPSSLTWFGQEAEQVTMSRDRRVASTCKHGLVVRKVTLFVMIFQKLVTSAFTLEEGGSFPFHFRCILCLFSYNEAIFLLGIQSQRLYCCPCRCSSRNGCSSRPPRCSQEDEGFSPCQERHRQTLVQDTRRPTREEPCPLECSRR